MKTQPRLRDLLAMHDDHAGKGTLPRVLGDGYFCAKNPVFQKIRKATLSTGFRYSSEDAAAYYGWPLMSLDMILEKRCIPFVDNVHHLRALEKRRPGHFGLSDLQSYGPTFNPLLHESAHGLASDALGYEPGESKPTRHRLMQTLVSEAYALTVETLSGLFVENAPLELYLHRLNTHLYQRALRRDPVRIMFDAFGFERTARATFASYLYFGFLYVELGHEELDRVVAFAGLPGRTARITKILQEVFSNSSRVRQDFRVDITGKHLRAQGFRGPLTQLVAFDPLAYAERHPDIEDAMTHLLSILTLAPEKRAAERRAR